MYDVYPFKMMSPCQVNTSLGSYMPYYENYFYRISDVIHATTPNHVQRKERERGSWTPFSWVEKYAYAFSGPYNKAEVALTFDDGPDLIFTPQILDTLKKYHVKATFFLLGENAERYPNIVKRIIDEEHIIGNHTYNHPNLAKVNEKEYHNQIIKTEEILNRLAGYVPKFVRPPYGEILENQLKWATEQNFMIVQWSVDTVDWKGVSAENITNHVLGNAFPGSIILQHSTPGGKLQGSVDALDRIIPELKMKGTRFVTLPNMFRTSKQRK
ncbi:MULTISPECIES: peptidoglycan-N-acetylglucosamine deacetylase [unclassified Bacillus cereus group]|uniref:peptidoglycan-N-acetylglucosamine deacetylase n=1 Tax=unclassified Bacillus cereus group TaxID=2750818 RepID=UPI001F59BF75|nr:MULTISPECIES: polysaccharide deacetylase family protein [unclassified Bacillus cereus group]